MQPSLALLVCVYEELLISSCAFASEHGCIDK
jgi:hypothetical protein